MVAAIAGRAVDARDWISERFIGGRIRTDGGRIWPGIERSRFRRRPECYDRLSVGRRTLRSASEIGGRSYSPAGFGYCRDQYACEPRGKEGNQHDTNRLHDKQRSGATRLGGEFEQARWQCNRRDTVERGGRSKKVGASSRTDAQRNGRRTSHQPQESSDRRCSKKYASRSSIA